MQSEASSSTKDKAHHWSDQVNERVLVRQSRPRLPPNPSSLGIHKEPRAISIAQLEKLTGAILDE